MSAEPSYDQIKASQMRSLAKHLPLNSLGLPTGYWRPDLLPLQEEVDNALGEVSNPFPETPVETTRQTDPLLRSEGVLADIDQFELFETSDETPDENIAPSKEHSFLNVSSTSSEVSRLGGNSNLPALLGIELPGIQTPLGLPQDMLDAAFVPLNYEEGYPALPNGWPFWEKLEFESPESHVEFKRYLELGRKEFRILPNLAEDTSHLELLNLYSALYYWPVRARCYDLFFQASRKREREALVYDLELDHLKCAQKYRGVIEGYMNSSEFEELLTPMVAVNLLKLCWQMERVSAGMPLNGPPGPNGFGGGVRRDSDLPQGSSLELVIRQMIKRERDAVPHDTTVLNEKGEPISAAEDAAAAFQERLLQQPELVTLAQELVLKLTTGGQT